MDFATTARTLAVLLIVAMILALSSCAKQATKVEVTAAECKNLGFVPAAAQKEAARPEPPIGRAFTATARGSGMLRFGEVSVSKNKAVL